MSWISVKEDIMPDEGEDVIIKNDRGKKTAVSTYVNSAFCRYNNFHEGDRLVEYYYNPTHWMPMPRLKWPRSR